MPREKLKPALVSLLNDARARHRTEAAAVTEALRLAIVSGILAPGVSLRQDLLASDLGVSRMPIREGIRRLESEGLIDFKPHCGAAVAPLRAEDIREIAQMRVALECLALGRAMAMPEVSRLDEAEHWLIQIDEADLLTTRNAFNRRFHYALYGAREDMRLLRHIDMLYDAYERYLIVEHSQLNRRKRSQEEHLAILSACRSKDSAKAQERLRSHIEGGADELIGFLQDQAKSA
jgi:DNA-binding GntR family transcriptional regulator